MRKTLVRSISTDRFDQRFGQMVCYFVSLLVLVLGILKVCNLGLDEAHLFFCLLLVLCLSTLCVIGGSMMEPTRKAG